MALPTPEIRPNGFPLNGRKAKPDLPENDFDRRMAMVLEHASRIFCEKGYEGASMRDLSRASGMSLAGLYHYFESKEELLYLIQKHTFTTIVEKLRERLEGVSDPEDRIRTFIHNHLEYSLANKEAMKVLVHEDDTLKNERGAEIAAIKREYYRICLDLLEELRRAKDLQFSGRLALLSLFGMVNWIYTWHNPRIDPDAVGLAEQMGDIFLHGVLHAAKPRTLNHKGPSVAESKAITAKGAKESQGKVNRSETEPQPKTFNHRGHPSAFASRAGYGTQRKTKNLFAADLRR